METYLNLELSLQPLAVVVQEEMVAQVVEVQIPQPQVVLVLQDKEITEALELVHQDSLLVEVAVEPEPQEQMLEEFDQQVQEELVLQLL
jgi:hypothetical protein